MSGKGFSVCVYGVNAEKRKKEIKEEFEKFGQVLSVHRSRKGVALVTFKDEDSCHAVIEKMKDRKIIPWKVSISLEKGSSLLRISPEIERLMQASSSRNDAWWWDGSPFL